MKILIICDTHFGVRNDNIGIQRQQKKFNDDIIQYIKENNIKKIFHGGDLFDRRKYINFNTLKFARETFLDPIENSGAEMDVILGNHDQYYKNTNEVNSLVELVRGYKNIRFHIDPIEIDQFLLLPWISNNNYEKSLNAIKNTKKPYCLGHLELNGFQMNRGHVCDTGMDKAIFNKFNWVGSGHFHHRSNIDNVNYIGAAYQFTWSDYSDHRGFAIFDTGKGNCEYINNVHESFNLYYYDDENNEKQIEADLAKDFSAYTDTYVKIRIKSKKNSYLFDLLVEKIQKSDPIKLSIVEDNLDLINEDNIDIENDIKDTPTLINNYVDGLKLDRDNNKIKSFMMDLYDEALSLENLTD